VVLVSVVELRVLVLVAEVDVKEEVVDSEVLLTDVVMSGAIVGAAVGDAVGTAAGASVGAVDGAAVGTSVTPPNGPSDVGLGVRAKRVDVVLTAGLVSEAEVNEEVLLTVVPV
jgi:hypothetical protein